MNQLPESIASQSREFQSSITTYGTLWIGWDPRNNGWANWGPFAFRVGGNNAFIA